MPQDRFFIGPPQEGLNNFYKDWLIADDAYAFLQNAYVWRGSLRKRFGSRYMGSPSVATQAQRLSRLRVNVGTTASVTIPSGANQLAIGQMFSIDTDVFYIYQTGGGVQTHSTTGSISISINTTVNPNTVTVTGGSGQTVYWYPARPVMGFVTFDTGNINDEFPIAFDTQFAYKYVNGWERLDQAASAGDSTWTGDNADFFWGANYRGATADKNVLFVTNFVSTDGIRTYDDSNATWTKRNFKYAADSGGQPNNILTARIIVYFKDRLVLLNLKENVNGTEKQFPNRCRFSQNGSPFANDAWTQAPEKYGRGGFIDAPTSEAIITAEFLKDRLIVFFERSTYELLYTGNRIQPFIWQKINTELGAESTFSQVPFDNAVLGVGNVGIHGCDGASVNRIDQKIPQEVFKIHNENDGVERVAGIRDFRTEMTYWTFPSFNNENASVFPNRVLIYNYQQGTWAFNDDSITAFGYWQRDEDLRWQDVTWTWQEWDSPWNSGSTQAKERFVMAGNQEGYTFSIDSDVPTNEGVLQVTDFDPSNFQTTVIDHNLTDDDFVFFSSVTGTAGLNDRIFAIAVDSQDKFTLQPTNDQLATTAISGVYTGGGTAARVSNIEVRTKDFNFYNKEDANVFIPRVDCYVDTTDSGEITLDSVVDSSDTGAFGKADGTIDAPILGTSVLETFPTLLLGNLNGQKRIWNSVYLNSEGQSLQLRFFFSDAQLRNPDISRVDFQLNAMVIYSHRTQDR